MHLFLLLFSLITLTPSLANNTIFLPILQHGQPPSTETVPIGPIRTGEITYYDADGTGNCLFDASPDNLMIAAMNHTDYDTAAMCGAYVRIDGQDGTIVVRIVDRCADCPVNNVDLSPQAFELVAPIAWGRVEANWQVVSPPLLDPIQYKFKEGSNQWWTAVQIRNHRTPIALVEYRDAAGVYRPIQRQMWNYFVEPSGLGVGPYTFRVTDIFGRKIIDTIPFTPDTVYDSTQQFPPPP